MANLTLEIGLGADWKDLTSALALTDGTTYIVDIADLHDDATIYSARTDSAVAPDGISGHPWKPISWGRGLGQMEYEQMSGVYIWARVDLSAATIVLTPV